jgi:hypothetical protein
MKKPNPSRTQALSLLLAVMVALTATAGLAGMASAATTTDLTVSITDDDDTIQTGETTTVELAVAPADGGVGAASLGVELSDSSVAQITDVEVEGTTTTPDIAPDGSSADVRYFQGDTADDGSEVVFATVTLQAQGAGQTDIDIGENSEFGTLLVGDENGAGYTLDSVGSATLSVTAPPGNSAPTIDAIADQTVTEGDSATVSVSASDADGDDVSLSLSQAPAFVSLSNGEVTVAPQSGDTGTYTVEVTADDDTDTATESFQVTVEEAAPAPAPGDGEVSVTLVGSDGDGEIAAGGTTTYDVVVEDVDAGVGAFEVTVSSGDTSVATVTDASITAPTADGDADFSSVSVSDSSTTLEAAARDTDDTGSIVIGTVTLTGQAEGQTDVSVDAVAIGDESGQSYAVDSETGAQLTVVEIQPVVGDEIPTDVDDDGMFEDVNGDGELTVADVQALWANRDAAAVTDFGDAYDFNMDGEFDIVDVQALWNEMNA